MVDSANYEVLCYGGKIARDVITLLTNFLHRSEGVLARDLTKFVGHAVSMERALGLQARMMSRSAARLCAAAPHWEAVVTLDDLVRREMRFFARESAVY
jgi:hypothetical protein